MEQMSPKMTEILHIYYYTFHIHSKHLSRFLQKVSTMFSIASITCSLYIFILLVCSGALVTGLIKASYLLTEC